MFAQIAHRLSELPVSARVALACRCAQRVLPFLTLPPQVEAREHHRRIFELTIDWSRTIAIKGGTFNLDFDQASQLEEFVAAVDQTASEYENAARWLRMRQGAHPKNVDLIRAVDAAFDAAAFYLSAAEYGYEDQDPHLDTVAIEKLYRCAEACACEDSLKRAIELDREWLVGHVENRFVPDSFFARAVWPEGEPADWLAMIKRARELMTDEHAWMVFLNHRRILLINQDSESSLGPAERTELNELERRTAEYFDRLAPLPFDELEKLETLAGRSTTEQ